MPKLENELPFASFITHEDRQYVDRLTWVLAEQNFSLEIHSGFYWQEKA